MSHGNLEFAWRTLTLRRRVITWAAALVLLTLSLRDFFTDYFRLSPVELFSYVWWAILTIDLLAVAAICRTLFAIYQTTRRLAAGLCPACGYDLRASKDRCPECGREIDRKNDILR